MGDREEFLKRRQKLHTKRRDELLVLHGDLKISVSQALEVFPELSRHRIRKAIDENRVPLQTETRFFYADVVLLNETKRYKTGPWLSPRECAKRVDGRPSAYQVRKLCKHGLLPFCRDGGGRIFVHINDFREFLDKEYGIAKPMFRLACE